MRNEGRHFNGAQFVRALLPQIVLLSVICCFLFLSFVSIIPPPQKLNDILITLFTTYGLPLIAVSSFLENLVGINVYFPGALTILTGMSLTAGNPTRAILTYFVIYIPAYVANSVSFLLGRVQRPYSEIPLTASPDSRIWAWFALTYFHPQLAAFTAFTVGATKAVSLKAFVQYSLPISLGWSVFWAIVIYHFGLVAHVSAHFVSIFVVYAVVWTLWDVWKFLRNHRVTS